MFPPLKLDVKTQKNCAISKGFYEFENNTTYLNVKITNSFFYNNHGISFELRTLPLISCELYVHVNSRT